MILEKCDMASTVCPKEMCANILGTNRKPVHEVLVLMLCKCIGNLDIFSKQFPFPLTLNVPTTHICVEIYDVILTRNCGELLGLGHWCFISNDLT